MKIKQVTVVSMLELDIPLKIYDTIGDYYEAGNDTYHRYYPSAIHKDFDSRVKQDFNIHLVELGVKFPEVLHRAPGHPDGYFSFYILLHFSW